MRGARRTARAGGRPRPRRRRARSMATSGTTDQRACRERTSNERRSASTTRSNEPPSRRRSAPRRRCRARGTRGATGRRGDHGRATRRAEPRPGRRRPRRDERRREHGRREQEALALRERRAREEHRGRGEPPAAPGRGATARAAARATTNEDVDRTSACGVRSRSPKRGTTRTSRSDGQRSHGGRVPMEQPGDRGDGAEDEEPELHVERDDVDAAHRVERGGVEDRQQRRVRRPGARREHLLVEAVEEEDRLRPSAPRTPRRRTPGGSAGAPRGTAPRAGGPASAMPGGRDEQDRRRADRGRRRSLRARAGRRRPATHAGRDAERRATRRSPPAERHADDEQLRPEDPERGDAEQVAEPGEPEHVAPTRGSRGAPRGARGRARANATLSAEEPGERADGHARRLRIDEAFLASSQTGSAPGYAFRSQREAEDPRRVGRSRRAGGSTACRSRSRRASRASLQPSCGSPTSTANVSSGGIRPRASIAIAWSGSTELPPPSSRSTWSSAALARAAWFASANASRIEPTTSADEHDGDAERDDQPTGSVRAREPPCERVRRSGERIAQDGGHLLDARPAREPVAPLRRELDVRQPAVAPAPVELLERGADRRDVVGRARRRPRRSRGSAPPRPRRAGRRRGSAGRRRRTRRPSPRGRPCRGRPPRG